MTQFPVRASLRPCSKRPLLTYIGLAYLWTWVTILPLLLQKRGVVELGLPDAWEAVGAFGPFVAAWLVIRRTEGPAGLAAFWRSLTNWRLGAGRVGADAAVAGGVPGAGRGAGDRPDGRAAVPGGARHRPPRHAPRRGGPGARWRHPAGPGRGAGLAGLPAAEDARPLPAGCRPRCCCFPVWWLWHLPFFLGRPEFGLPQFLGFGLGILSASIWLTFLWERTRSALVAVAWHAVLNITRGIALGFSTGMFLAYGMVVAVGALGIVAWWLVRRR